MDTSSTDQDQDKLLSVWMRAVLATVGADSMGRAKLMGWQVPKANRNGGWCGCMTRGLTRVRVFLLSLDHEHSHGSQACCELHVY